MPGNIHLTAIFISLAALLAAPSLLAAQVNYPGEDFPSQTSSDAPGAANSGLGLVTGNPDQTGEAVNTNVLPPTPRPKKPNEISAPPIDGSHGVYEEEQAGVAAYEKSIKKNFLLNKVKEEKEEDFEGENNLPTSGTGAPDSGLTHLVGVPSMAQAKASGSKDNPAKTLFAEAAKKYRMGDYEGAIQSAREALANDPGDYKAYNLVAVANNRIADAGGSSSEQRAARYRQAESAALEALRLKPDYAPAYESLAWEQLRLGNLRDAVASSANAVTYDPKRALGFALRAYANQMLDRQDLMLADIERAASLNPALFDDKLKRAQRGEAVYDPNAEDSWQLLRSVGKGRTGGLSITKPVAAGLGVAFLVLACLGVFAWQKLSPLMRRRPSSERMKAALSVQNDASGVLAGKYQLTRVIGKGGMGEVWEAEDISLGRAVAVKKVALEGEFEARAREMVIKEARTLAALHHPNIVDIYEVLDLPSGLHLVFELLSGKTVQQMLAECRRFPLARAKDILKPVCEALEFAHSSSVVHRDLKPSNIMVTERGYVKIMDFGIARRIQDRGPQAPGLPSSVPASLPSAVRTQTVAGTPAYMAPEAESGIVTPALDVYALGVCLYEMLTGELPFGAAPQKRGPAYVKASERVPELPKRVDALIDSALDPNLATRMKTVQEFRLVLETIPA